jgi:hypothetical protein
MRYTPNQMAVQLRQRQSHLVGLVIPEITMFFYPSVIRGIEEVLEPRGYRLVMLPSNESPIREARNLRFSAKISTGRGAYFFHPPHIACRRTFTPVKSGYAGGGF